MGYQVRFVSDHSLPEDVEWVFVRQSAGTFLFVKQSAVNPITLTRAWETWQAAEAQSARALAVASA